MCYFGNCVSGISGHFYDAGLQNCWRNSFDHRPGLGVWLFEKWKRTLVGRFVRSIRNFRKLEAEETMREKDVIVDEAEVIEGEYKEL